MNTVPKGYGSGFYIHRYSAYIFKSSKYKLWTIVVDTHERKVVLKKSKRKDYYITPDTINLAPGYLNRKNLMLTTKRCEAKEETFIKCYYSDDETRRKHTFDVYSQCTAYTDIKKLKKKIKSEMSWVKQNLEDEYKRKSKGNKI